MQACITFDGLMGASLIVALIINGEGLKDVRLLLSEILQHLAAMGA